MLKVQKYFLLCCLALLSFSSITAQQVRERQRSTSIFMYPQFKKGKILQTFGRSITDSINIFLKDASLLFLKDGKIMQAHLNNILGVVIDSTEYKKVNNQLGRVIEKRGYNCLICVTSLDKERYESETKGGEKLPFFELEQGAFFIPFTQNQNEYESEKGIPLKDKYYFWLQGEVVPANETKIKPYIKEDMKTPFQNLMTDRWWSWNNPDNLKQLFMYFKE